MLQSILKIKKEDLPKHLDATDGLAAAVCHHFQGKSISSSSGSKANSWAAFVKQNEKRVKK